MRQAVMRMAIHIFIYMLMCTVVCTCACPEGVRAVGPRAGCALPWPPPWHSTTGVCNNTKSVGCLCLRGRDQCVQSLQQWGAAALSYSFSELCGGHVALCGGGKDPILKGLHWFGALLAGRAGPARNEPEGRKSQGGGRHLSFPGEWGRTGAGSMERRWPGPFWALEIT